jgi:hypothetical protein
MKNCTQKVNNRQNDRGYNERPYQSSNRLRYAWKFLLSENVGSVFGSTKRTKMQQMNLLLLLDSEFHRELNLLKVYNMQD